jgi:bifunctional DNA-binding transcriptional regulator/antitoxin component of YhaV-PrlF toxin-antitoxin module
MKPGEMTNKCCQNLREGELLQISGHRFPLIFPFMKYILSLSQIRLILYYTTFILTPNFGNSIIQKGVAMTKTIQIRKKGSLTLPMELRKRYQLDEGDPVTLVDLEEGIFLSPKVSVLPKLVAQIEELRQQNNMTLAELIEGVRTLRDQS